MAQGRYFYLQSALNGFVLEVSEAPASGVRVVMQPYDGKDNQLFYEDPIFDVLRSKANDDYVLDMNSDGDSLIINECRDECSSQKWHFYKNRVVNLETAKSLDIAGANADPGATVLCWDYGGLPHQTFTRVYVEPKPFLLRSRLHGKCLDISGGDASAGANIIVWPEHGGENQQWYEGRHGTIHSKINGFVLDSSDDHVELQPYDGTLQSRQWLRSGRRLLNLFDQNQCLEIKDGSEDDSAETVHGTYSGQAHQLWEAVFL